MQKISEFSERVEKTIARTDIVEVAQEAFRNEEPVVLSPQGKGVSFFCFIVEVEETCIILRNPIPAKMAPFALAADSFGLYCKAYWLQCEKLQALGTFLKFAVPEQATMGQARNAERIYFSAKENAVVEIQHPFDPATKLRRRVFDLSSGGMSFRARVNTPFIQPGRLLPSCQIFIQGLPREKRKGRVVYVKQIIDLNGQSYYQVGVQFLGPDEEEHE